MAAGMSLLMCYKEHGIFDMKDCIEMIISADIETEWWS